MVFKIRVSLGIVLGKLFEAIATYESRIAELFLSAFISCC